jgi:hypothetical protein
VIEVKREEGKGFILKAIAKIAPLHFPSLSILRRFQKTDSSRQFFSYLKQRKRIFVSTSKWSLSFFVDVKNYFMLYLLSFW